MYDFETIKTNENTYLVRYKKGSKIVSVAEFISLLANNDDFRRIVNESVIKIPFKAYFFEGTPMAKANEDLDYFWLAVKTNFAKGLKADPRGFQNVFNQNKKRVVSFTSPSGTTLVSPAPIDNYQDYLHLKLFCSKADPSLVNQFWQVVGETAADEMKMKYRQIGSDQTWWLKTHGHAIDYLHYRIQSNTRLYVTPSLKDLVKAYDLYDQVIN